jgi:sortase A
MDIKNFFSRNRRKIIRYTGITLIIVGVLIIMWPFYTNFIVARREAEILTSWNEEWVQPQDTIITEENDQDDTKPIEDIKLVDPEQKLPFRISIPEINLDWIVNEGTDYATLREGPGFFISSAFPGEEGTCVVAGHRTTYGSPFNRLDELEEGDEIFIETAGKEEFTYIVTGIESVLPTDISVLEYTSFPSLVLSTCTPKYYSTRRLIVFARIIE